VRAGRKLPLRSGPRCSVASVVFLPGGKILAAEVIEEKVVVWDAWSGKVLTPVGGHHSGIASVAFSSDGKKVLSVDAEAALREWNLAGKQLRRLHLPPPDLHGGSWWKLSSDGAHVLGDGERVRLWKVASGREVFSARGWDPGVFPLGLTADASLLAVVGGERF